MKVLVVDDLMENRMVLEAILKGTGYETVSAKNGLDALDKLKTENVGLIVSDIMMPKMDGFQLCIKCKGNEKLAQIPFVFYTSAFTDRKDEEFGLLLGAERYIVKPLQAEKLIKVVNEVTQEKGRGGAVGKPSVNPEEMLELYSKRLFDKLIQKVTDLEKEVDERKKAQSGLITSEKRFREVFLNPFSGIAIFEIKKDDGGKPEDFTFMMVNPAFEKILDLYMDELENKTISEVLPGIRETPLYQALEEVASNGKASSIDTYLLKADRYFNVSAFTPRRGELAAVFFDITDRMPEEEEE